MAALAAPLADLPILGEVRQTGMIVAFELVRERASRTPLPAERRAGLVAYRHALQRGVLLRPLGDVLYWMPPYCIDEDALRQLAAVTASAIEEVHRACA
jgi:adenosylmethionine---8-amino-7-oxononanoate aminotransferase